MQNPLIGMIIFLLAAALVLGLPFFVLILGLVTLKSSRITSSRFFDAGIHILTIAASIPAVMFLWFIPTIALLIGFLSADQIEPTVRMVIIAFAVIGFALQLMFIRDTLRKDLRDKGLTFTQAIRRSFNREYKEQLKVDRDDRAKHVDEIYSKLDDISGRPWAVRRRKEAEIAKQAEMESAADQREKLAKEQPSEPILKRSSLITTILSLVGTFVVIFILAIMVGLDAILAQNSDAIRILGDYSLFTGAIFIFFGAISVFGVQRSRSEGVTYSAVVAGVTDQVLDQAKKDLDRWSYTSLAWITVYIGGLLILNAIALTVVFFPAAIFG